MDNLRDSQILKINEQLQNYNLVSGISRAIDNNAEDLLNLVRDQMRSGEDSEGPTRNYSSMEYAVFKSELPSYRAPFGRVDNYLTGSFQAKMYIKETGSIVEFWSYDPKTPDIVYRETKNIFELNPERMEIAQSIVEEGITNELIAIFE